LQDIDALEQGVAEVRRAAPPLGDDVRRHGEDQFALEGTLEKRGGALAAPLEGDENAGVQRDARRAAPLLLRFLGSAGRAKEATELLPLCP
jgi:hypothetical protein